MPETLRFIAYLLAVVCFVVEAFWDINVATRRGPGRFDLLSLGLAFGFTPALWDAAEAMP